MKRINRLLESLYKDTTRAGEVYYFVIVQRWLFLLMSVYYLLHLGICFRCGFQNAVVISIFWFALMAAGFYFTYHYSDMVMFRVFLSLMLTWVCICLYFYGWGVGGQHFLLSVLVMLFFCVHLTRKQKIYGMLTICLFRIFLFLYCLGHEPVLHMDDFSTTQLQILNSLILFISMSIICISFSSNIQAFEIKLMNANQSLREQANTDQLTRLPNRRCMISFINEWITENPSSLFSVAMSDIDFFKRINDTWGHECGDEVLKTLAAFFEKELKDKGMVCRWGGEEFFFFFPDMNLDQAQYACEMMNFSIRNLMIPYKDQVITITMTFGVEESDYGIWDLDKIVEKADEKLYIGKQKGRNQVVA